MTTNTTEQADFDFDEMALLARVDPDAFEQQRRRMLNDVIEQASPELQRRMHGLQWQIDQVRASADNPISACLRISRMMWDSVLEEDGLLENLQRLQSGQTLDAKSDKPVATIIPLHVRRSEHD